MKKYKFFCCSVSTVLLSLMFTFMASANSSWVWITETRPYDVLPFVIIITLIVETLAIDSIARIGKWTKTFFAVLVGNILSFLAPYMIYANFSEPYSGAGYGLKYILNRGPYYTVGGAFLVLTIIIELPFIYWFLKKDTESKKKLTAVIIAVNVVTTIFVAITERLLCQGRW